MKTVPICGSPVGEGAMRVQTGLSVMKKELSTLKWSLEKDNEEELSLPP
jgi:hypothetical protein